MDIDQEKVEQACSGTPPLNLLPGQARSEDVERARLAGDEFLARKRVHLESGNQGQVPLRLRR